MRIRYTFSWTRCRPSTDKTMRACGACHGHPQKPIANFLFLCCQLIIEWIDIFNIVRAFVRTNFILSYTWFVAGMLDISVRETVRRKTSQTETKRSGHGNFTQFCQTIGTLQASKGNAQPFNVNTIYSIYVYVVLVWFLLWKVTISLRNFHSNRLTFGTSWKKWKYWL